MINYKGQDVSGVCLRFRPTIAPVSTGATFSVVDLLENETGDRDAARVRNVRFTD